LLALRRSALPSRSNQTLAKFKEEMKEVLKPMWSDYDLLRFLRARDWNIQNAATMVKNNLVRFSFLSLF
jgi:hypothetical protein